MGVDLQRETAALRRLATALTVVAATADDLVQDTWVAALEKPPASDRPVGPWLRTVLRRRRGSTLRAGRRRAHYETLAAGAEATTPDAPDRLQLLRQLLDHVQALPDGDRELIVMRFLDGLSAVECAARLDRPASTVRTQLQRALDKLRRRLDRHGGGRKAWLAALLPWVEMPSPGTATATATTAATTATKPLWTPASISVGGVLAAAGVWLGLAAHQGCGATAENVGASDEPSAANATAGEVGDVGDVGDESRSPTRTAAGSTRAATSSGHAPPRPRPNDEEGDPCENLDRDDSPEYASILAEGRTPTKDEKMAAYIACRRRNPTLSYGAPEGREGGVHPHLAVTMAMQHAWSSAGPCFEGDPDASARARIDIVVDTAGQVVPDKVTFDQVVDLDAEQLDCLRQHILAIDNVVRDADVTQAGFDAGTSIAWSLLVQVHLEDGLVGIDRAGEIPRKWLVADDEPAMFEAIDACTSSPATMVLTLDPQDSHPTRIVPAPGTDPATGKCIAAALRAHVGSQSFGFFPRVPDHAKLRCRFGLDETRPPAVRGGEPKRVRYECENMGPPSILEFRVVDSER